ncbi:major capsid protein [Dipodfec virus RodF1_17]|uniref:Major capsid protein n=1 Tax=Dipodfec virus RodF1_17 TaxID=2929293 RepID=A0A976N360_9VIRU|nr:major capsid protein [Dipodfec virus RodF1_17]
MAKGYDKMHIKSAIRSRSNIDLDHSHMTTIDFGQLCVLNYFDGIPGDKVHYKYDLFSRIAPLNYPVYGNFSLRTVNFFVPYYQIADEIEGFFSGQKMYHGSPTSIRYTTLRVLMTMFTDLKHGLCTSGTSTKYNFSIVAQRSNVGGVSSPTIGYYYLTAKGRFVYKVLRSLGYDFPANIDLSDTTASTNYLSTKVNLLPLLGYFKAYNDWMTNSVHYNRSSMTKYLQAIRFKDDTVKVGTSNDAVVTSTGFIGAAALVELFKQVRLLYDSDYFTSAWRYPNDPDGNSTQSGNQVAEVDVYPYGVTSAGGNPTLEGIGEIHSSMISTYSSVPDLASDNLFSARQLRFLQAFDNWVRRNNYAGSRAVNQIYSRFGIKPTEFRAQYAEFISKDSIPLRVGDVTQTSQSTTTGDDVSPLGSYAGKGIANGDHGVSYQFNDYGILLTMCYVWVDPLYYRGFHRNVLKTDPLDFYNPEFDGVGPEAISMLELWNDPASIKGVSEIPAKLNDGNNVFGFTERYNDMRFQRDQITGDFELYHFMKPWHFGRDLSLVRDNGKVAQSDSVVYYTPRSTGDYEYDRVFATTQYSEEYPIEHFYLQCLFTGSASRPIRNLSSVADLGDGDLTIDRLGQQVS